LPSAISQLGAIYMPVDGLIEVEGELKKLNTQLDKVNGDLQRVMRKLENMDFINKAPAEVIAQQQDWKKELIEKGDKLRKLIETLSGCAGGSKPEA
jgi:valyl-tRNA synthetase